MQILLTNDDGIHAPGLEALNQQLQTLGDVTVVAPATEQSGVGHSITFLTPLFCKPVYDGDIQRGWAVEGTPADCVKIGIFEHCPKRPDLIVSGINGGLNAGINVLYSGTVAGAIEGAFFGIDSVAVSLEYDDRPNFERAAEIAVGVIKQVLEKKDAQPQLYNLNIPTAATQQPFNVRMVPMGTEQYGQDYIKRQDPKGRTYYWASGNPPPKPTEFESDLTALRAGHVTLSPLHFDMTSHKILEQMKSWAIEMPDDRQA
ncbi:MAG: 5'/3'-nucleotidase SurE [Planctomycetota bacterium]